MHTMMAYLAVLGKHFGELGLGDLLVETNFVASGSLSAVLEVHQLKLTIRSHNIVMEALFKIKWKSCI